MQKAVIISAPSGSGKTTIVKYLLEKENRLAFSISATSRQKRPGEIHGRDYYFMTSGEFIGRIKANDFVEWEQVYPDIYYGTLKSEIDRIWKEKKAVIFDVDVKGGLSLKKYFSDKGLSFFIKVPDFKILEKRLRDRHTESENSLRTRLEKASSEMQYESSFDEVVVNDDLEAACRKIADRISGFLKE